MIRYSRKLLNLLLVTLLALGTVLPMSEASAQPPPPGGIAQTNVSNAKFTISWITGSAVTGWIEYGTNPASLNPAYDVRGQAVSSYTHYVTVTALSSAITYYYDVISGGVRDDNNGAHYAVTTGPTLTPPPTDAIYGQVFKSDNTTLAAGTIVYITTQGAQVLSSLVASSGYWNVNLGEIRTAALSAYLSYTTATLLSINAEGGPVDGRASQIVAVSNTKPAPRMVLALVDTMPPTVATTVPTANATGVAINTAIQVTFSESMNTTSAQGAFSISPTVIGSFGWTTNNITMTFTPAANLNYTTLYTVTISTAAKDLAGNSLAQAKIWSFSTIVPPAVTTNPATYITTNSARLNGSLTSLGSYSSANVSFEWGTTSGNLTQETAPQTMNSTSTFYFYIMPLAPNTTYYFRAKAKGDGPNFGAERSFTTGKTPPAVTTGNATGVTTTSATLNGSLDNLGSYSSANVSFRWGTSPIDLASQNETTPIPMTSPGPFSASLTGLSSNTTYYFKAVARANGVLLWGSVLSFTTAKVPPTVTTSAASNVTHSSATLNGNLTSLGDYAYAYLYFRWGTVSGNLTDWKAATPSWRTTPGSFSANVTGLASNTTYFFFAKAVVDGITVPGSELSFTTAKTPPVVTTNPATNITTDSATLSGNLTSLGDYTPVNVSFVWGQTQGGPYPNTTTPQPKTATGVFNAPITGLTLGATYYFKAKATADGEIVYGGELSFTTARLVLIDITPDNQEIPKGRTLQFTATGTYSDNSTAPITAIVTWTSTNTTVATIEPNTGLARGLAVGTTTIYATSGNVSDNTTLRVLPPVLESIAVTPANVSVPLGKPKQFTATGTYSDNSTPNITDNVTWTSSNLAKATISSTGLATTVAVGDAIITARQGAISGSTTLTITSAVLDSITVTPVNPPIALGQSQQFSANGTYSDGKIIIVTTTASWTSSNTSVATIGVSTGLARSLAIGQTTITATKDGKSDNTTLTVTAAQFTELVIIPDNPSIAAGTTIPLSATARYTDGTRRDVTATANWTSNMTTTANITAPGRVTGIAQGTANITAQAVVPATLSPGDNTTLTVSDWIIVTVTAPTLKSIAIDQRTPTVAAGRTLPLSVIGTYSDNSTANLTSTAVWASRNLTVARISTTGLVTGVAAGTANITATHSGLTDSVSLTVTAPVLDAITVTPASPTVAAGYNIQFTATGNYSDGSTAVITTTANWTSDNTSVATIGANSGVATTVAAGSTVITATKSGVSGNTTLTVTPATLQSLAVTPTNPSVAAGRTQQFTATGTYSDNSTDNITAVVTWTSSDTSKATIAAGGLATTLASGTTIITATLGAVSGNTTLTVTAAVLDSIAVTPANPSIAAGRTQPFTATGTYSNGATAVITTSANWTSDNNTIASIVSPGVIRGNVPGTTVIRASLSGKEGTANLTVTAPVLTSIAVTPPNPSIPAGRPQQFTATGNYTDNSTANITATVTWSSSNTAVASISPTGLATSYAWGTANITATLGSVSGSTILTVTMAVVDSVAVTPLNPTIVHPPEPQPPSTQQFRAMATYSNGSRIEITTTANWTSSNETVATIGLNTGLATSRGAGQTTITARLGTVSGNTTLTVTAATLQSIAVTPATPSVAAGRTLPFSANATYSDNSWAIITTMVTWSSSDNTVARVNAAGLATSYAQGTANITATSGNVSGSTTLTVGTAALESVTVTPVNPTVTFVSRNPPTLQFTATATYSDGKTEPVTTTANWTSSVPGVASIGRNTGLATTANPGATPRTTTITANYTAGDVTKSPSTILTVLPDTVPPVVTLTSPTEGLVLSDTNLTVSGSIDDVAATANVTVNGVPSTLTLVNGNFSQGVLLKNGNNTVLVTAVDGSGNTGTSGTITVRVDPRRPKVTVTSPAGGTLTNQPALTITGTVTGAGLSATLIFNGTSRTLTLGSQGSFSANVTLVEGVNIIVVNAYPTGTPQFLGTSGVITVTLDTIAPVVTINSPMSGSVVSNPMSQVSGTVNDPYVATAQLILNQGAAQSVPVVGGNFTQNITLVPGSDNITVVATDAAGNSSNATATLITITLDITKPVVTIITPTNNLVTNIAGQTVNGTVSDPTITSANLTLNRGTPQIISVAPDGSFNAMVTLTAGLNTIEVTAADNATPPNSGTSGVVNVEVDITPPALTIALSDPTDSITITVSSNETLVAAPSVSVNATSITMTAFDVNKWSGIFAPIPPSQYSVTANGTDIAGNLGTATADFVKGTIVVDGITPTTLATATGGTTTLAIETYGYVTADISVTEHLFNPSGNVKNPEGAPTAAGAFVEIVAAPALQDNLKQIIIRVYYDPNALPAGTDEDSLKLYLWDVAIGTWQVVPDSGVNTTEHYIFGTVTHLSKYGSFGKLAAPVTPPTPPTAGGGGGGGGGGAPTTVTISGLTSAVTLKVDENGLAQDAYQPTTLDQKVSLDIAKGTKLLDAQGKALGSLSAAIVTSPPAPPAQRAIVQTYDFGPNGATFDPALTMTMSYDPASLSRGVSEGELYLAYWDGSKWVALESTVNAEANTVAAKISHFTQFALMGKLPPPPPPPPPTAAPAKFTVSDFSLTPREVKPAEPVTVSVLVTNTGGSEGKYTVVLKVDGAEEASKEVTIKAGASQTVSFSLVKSLARTYEVDVNGLTGSFTVKEEAVPVPPEKPVEVPTPVPGANWWLIGGIIAAVVVVGLLVYFVWRRRAA